MTTILSIKMDGGPMQDALIELSELLVKAPQAIGQRLVELVENGAKLSVLENDRGSALGAGEFVMVAKPANGLLHLLAALRAGDCDLLVVERSFGHDAPSLEDNPGSVAGSGLTRRAAS